MNYNITTKQLNRLKNCLDNVKLGAAYKVIEEVKLSKVKE